MRDNVRDNISKRILVTVILGMIILFILVGRLISYETGQEDINKINKKQKVRETVTEPEEIKVFNNAWVTKLQDGVITFYHDGIFIDMEVNDIQLTGQEFVADIEIRNGIITSIIQKADRRKDRILMISEQTPGNVSESASENVSDNMNGEGYITLETLNNGTLTLPDSTVCYDISDNGVPEKANINELPIGYDVTDIVYDAGGNVSAILVTDKIVPQNIRVAIKNSGYKSHYHKKVIINSDAGMTITQNGSSYTLPAGQTLEYDKTNAQLPAGRIVIMPCEGGRLYLENIKRGYNNPAYRGSVEITLQDKGIVVVNELPINEYLYAVVPSEMPVSYGVEALKVQAVCARTYAYIHVRNPSLMNLGAHVDDSTSYQVYNNTKEAPEAIEAINATGGQVLTYNGDVVPTYYYSTSCGVTAKGKEVWFGMKDVPYLTSNLQTTQTTLEALGLDLSDDDQFKQFLEREDIATFDSTFPWYRWNVSISAKDIKESVDKSIESRYNANPSLILTKAENGDYVSEPVTTVGDIISIKIAERSECGLVTQVIVKGSEHTVKIKSEYNIRMLLAPLHSNITRKDGSVVNGLSILPSAFFVMTQDGKGDDRVFNIQGGGYGHGVGMSQNGTRNMVLAGCGYADILKFYYSGCEITDMNKQ